MVLAALAGASGCGTATPRPPPSGVVSSPTGHAQATPTPAAVSTPAPLPPLAILESSTGDVSALDSGGHLQWSLSAAQVHTLLAASGHDTTSVRVAGPNVLLSVVTADTVPVGRVVLLDGTGTSLGGGSFTPSRDDTVVGAPTGVEWAYSVDESPLSASRHHGRIVVAGLGVAPHTVFSWVAPPGDTERVADWSDMGIVMERVSLGGCGAGFHPDSASFLVDPQSGALTDLFSGNHYGDARHGVKAAYAARSQSAVIIDGASFDVAGTIADTVFVSPDGATVGIGRFSVGGCAGFTAVTVTTELVNVSTGGHTDVRDCRISGWFDAGHFVCAPYNTTGQPMQRLEALNGTAGATLGAGSYLGALSSS